MDITSGYLQKRNHETITKYAGEENNESAMLCIIGITVHIMFIITTCRK